jgi:ankyrin repeat protein
MGVAPLPFRAGLEQYTRQATDLVKSYHSGDPEAIYCIRQLHPHLRGRAHTNDRNDVTDAEICDAGVTLADAQCVVARWYGFEDWPTLAEFVDAVTRKGSPVWQFESAVEAIITGDVATLKGLLADNRELIRARSPREHHATLLHYVGANGVEGYRQKTPKNAVKVAEILLKAGADVDADLDYGSLRPIYPERTGSTPLGMVATSVHPAAAGVQIALLKILLKHGASVDGLAGGWNPLIAALRNGRPEAAAFLARCGARLDLEGAAGVGRLDIVKGFFKKDGALKVNGTKAQMESGFMWACQYGRISVVAFLLAKGMRVGARPHGETGLHQAAYGGHAGIVKLLLERKAPVDVKDSRYDHTPLGWALHGWHYPPPEAKRRNHVKVVALLVAAGSTVDQEWLQKSEEARKVRADPRMLAALSGKLPPMERAKGKRRSQARFR